MSDLEIMFDHLFISSEDKVFASNKDAQAFLAKVKEVEEQAKTARTTVITLREGINLLVTFMTGAARGYAKELLKRTEL